MDKTRRKFLQTTSAAFLGLSSVAAAAHHEGMFVHVFLFKFRPEISEDEIADLMKQLAGLKDKIPVLKEFLIGKDTSGRNRGYHYAQVSIFEKEEDLQVYEEHPEHRKLVRQIGPKMVGGLAMDFVPL